MNAVIEKLGKYGVVPVIKIDNQEDAKPLASALVTGGLPVAEITFRTNAAADAIRVMNDNFPEMLIGAGTVLTPEKAEEAVNAGAKFIVSPGYNQEVVDYCQNNDIPIVPGVNNPSLIEQAIRSNLDVVKFFPAEASGGLSMIKNLAPVYPGVNFMPTGGINPDNIGSYLSYDRIVGCGGTWMVKGPMINEKKFDLIEKEVKKAVLIAQGFEFAHMGIHCESAEKAGEASGTFGNLFGFDEKEGSSSFFASSAIEIVKSMYLEKTGHIAIKTNNIGRAVFYLENRGIGIRKDTIKKSGEKTIAVYLDSEIAGIPIHLLQRS